MTPASLVRVQTRPPPGGIRTLFGRAPAAEVMDVRADVPAEPAVINEAVGRFALWGFRAPDQGD